MTRSWWMGTAASNEARWVPPSCCRHQSTLGYNVGVGGTSVVERLDIAAWTTFLLLWTYALCWALFSLPVLELSLLHGQTIAWWLPSLPLRTHLAPFLALFLSIALGWWRRSRRSRFAPELETDLDAGNRSRPPVQWSEFASVSRRAYVLHLQRLTIVLLLFWVTHRFPVAFGRIWDTGVYSAAMVSSPNEYMVVKAEWLMVFLFHLPTRRLVLGQRPAQRRPQRR